MESFRELIKEVKAAYDKSDIKRDRGTDWGYTVLSTRINRHSPLIVGFNAGVSHKQKEYLHQEEVPEKTFADLKDKKWLGSFNRIPTYLKQYLPEVSLESYMMTNFCFFRSEKENQITYHDLQLCKPLFDKLLNVIQPSMIIGFSSSLKNHLIRENLYHSIQSNSFQSGNKSVYVSKGEIGINDPSIPVYFLPHPNTPIKGEARHNAWDYCFNN